MILNFAKENGFKVSGMGLIPALSSSLSCKVGVSFTHGLSSCCSCVRQVSLLGLIKNMKLSSFLYRAVGKEVMGVGKRARLGQAGRRLG